MYTEYINYAGCIQEDARVCNVLGMDSFGILWMTATRLLKSRYCLFVALVRTSVLNLLPTSGMSTTRKSYYMKSS